MSIQLVALAILSIAIASVYIIQWAKGPFPKADPFIWWLLSPVLNMGLAFVTVLGIPLGVPLLGFLIVGALSWAISQAGYELIVKHVPLIMESFAKRLEAQAESAKSQLPK